MVEALGLHVLLVPGHPRAFKVTTAQDLLLAEASWSGLPGGRAMTALPLVGIGMDVHPYADPELGRELALACLAWPGENGLAGHSDADVAAHASVTRCSRRPGSVTSGPTSGPPSRGGRGRRGPPCSARRCAG